MAVAQWFDLPFYEILIPIIIWSIVLAHHIYLVRGHVYSLNYPKHAANGTLSVYSFFASIRVGWVKQNHLTGQASANTTRDYLRVLLFYTGNAVLLAGIMSGYCVNSYDPDNTPYSHLLTAKLGMISCLFLCIFFVMVYAVRYGNHFHFLMNCKEVNGFQLATQFTIIEKVYHKSHFFYSTAVRMYFLLIPCFAWLISCWLMILACPFYMFLISQYDDLSWLQADVDLLFKKAEEKEKAKDETLLISNDNEHETVGLVRGSGAINSV